MDQSIFAYREQHSQVIILLAYPLSEVPPHKEIHLLQLVQTSRQPPIIRISEKTG